jgi:hypothetical protein
VWVAQLLELVSPELVLSVLGRVVFVPHKALVLSHAKRNGAICMSFLGLYALCMGLQAASTNLL